MKISSLRMPVVAAVLLFNSSQAQIASAQVVPDNSLGAESSIITITNSTLTPEGLSKRLHVEGGAVRGNSLFHSFSEFGIGSGQRVYFSPESGITNIFTRVTGEMRSEFFGTLGVLGNADLFLMNPNGFVFGDGATLNVNGSFFATSADAIAFGEGFTFSALDPNSPPQSLLNVQPTALFFNQLEPASITSNAMLNVKKGQSIQLIGGDVSLALIPPDKKRVNNALKASDGIIELGGLSEPGIIQLSAEGRVQMPADALRANVSLTDARITVVGKQDGNISIYSKDLTFTNARIIAGIKSNHNMLGAQTGDIVIDASGSLMATGTQIINGIRNNSRGSIGDIVINVDQDLLLNSSKIRNIINKGKGERQGGNVEVMAGGNAHLHGDSVIDTYLDKGAGQLQNVEVIVTGTLRLDSSDILNTVNKNGEGNSGNLTVEAATLEVISMAGAGHDRQRSLVATNNEGNGSAGTLRVTVNSLDIEGSGNSGKGGLTANASSRENYESNAGSIVIEASGPITMTRRGKIEARVSDTIGDAGYIAINADSLSLDNSSLIQASATRVQGSPGRIVITLEDGLDIDNNSAILGGTDVLKPKDLIDTAASVTITADSVNLYQGGVIRVSSLGAGNAGDITISARSNIDIFADEQSDRDSGLYSRSRAEAIGSGGEIRLGAEQLRVRGNAVISTETESSFAGGDINIDADQIELLNGGQINTSASNEGDAGNITISASDRILIAGRAFVPRVQPGANIDEQDNSEVTASGIYLSSGTSSESSAGDLVIEESDGGSLDLRMEDGGEINANTASGQGGNITFRDLDTVVMRRASYITADAQVDGDGGNIDFSMPEGHVVAVLDEDSDIVVRAVKGVGGDITITALSILGFVEQRGSQRDNGISEIDASSKLGENGNVVINSPLFDPIQGMVELPADMVSTTQVAQRCLADIAGRNAFVFTGQGGTPPSPSEVVRNETASLVDLGDGAIAYSTTESVSQIESIHSSAVATIEPSMVEAKHWQRDAQGNVVLSAQAEAPEAVNQTEYQSCT